MSDTRSDPRWVGSGAESIWKPGTRPPVIGCTVMLGQLQQQIRMDPFQIITV